MQSSGPTATSFWGALIGRDLFQNTLSGFVFKSDLDLCCRALSDVRFEVILIGDLTSIQLEAAGKSEKKSCARFWSRNRGFLGQI